MHRCEEKFSKQCQLNNFILICRNFTEFRKHFRGLADGLYASLDITAQRNFEHGRDYDMLWKQPNWRKFKQFNSIILPLVQSSLLSVCVALSFAQQSQGLFCNSHSFAPCFHSSSSLLFDQHFPDINRRFDQHFGVLLLSQLSYHVVSVVSP